MSNRIRTILSLLILVASAGTSVFAGFPGTDVFLPMVGRQAGVGASNWYTTVWIHNPGTVAATATVYLLERGTSNPSPPSVEILVAPGDTEMLENVVDTYFHRQIFGAMRVACPAQKLVVTSRVYSQAVGMAEKDSMGQDFAGVPASFAIGLGEKTQILGVYQTIPATSSEFRYNFGFVETTGNTVTVRVRAFDDNNAEQGSKDFQVLRFSQRQVAFKDHFPTVSTECSRLEVEVISGAGKVIAYGSGIANASNDPTTFEMAYPSRVLAESAAPGITGVTAGNGLTGGGTSGTVTLDIGAGAGIAVTGDQVSVAAGGVTNGMLADGAVGSSKIIYGAVSNGHLAGGAVTTDKIADGNVIAADLANGAVTPAKLDTTGAASGQVLKVGSPAHWADDGLTLPFQGTGNTTTAVFSVANTDATTTSVGILGAGRYGVQGNGGLAGVVGTVDSPNAGFFPAAVAGSAGTKIGVNGTSISSEGVFGKSTSGVGVRGESTSSDGVLGRASAAGMAGVRGSNPDAAGWAGYFQGRVGITGALDCTGCVVENDIAGGAVSQTKLGAAGAAAGRVLGTDGSGLQWVVPPQGTVTGVTAGTGLTGGGTSGSVTVGIANGGVGTLQLADDAVTTQKIPNGAVESDDLALGAVKKASLSAPGGAPGQVLGTDGTGLQWKDESLTLPFAATQASASTLFSVANISSGYAISGGSSSGAGVAGHYGTPLVASVGGVGVLGQAQGGTGVLGMSDYGWGVKGWSASSMGVRGEGSIGVFGTGSTGVNGQSSTGYGVLAESWGYGLTGPALLARAGGPGGVAISAEASSIDAAVVVANTGNGSGLVAGSPGSTGVIGYSGVGRPTQMAGVGVYGVSSVIGVLARSWGTGRTGAALNAQGENSSGGMAAYLRNSSDYATAHVANSGPGEVLYLQGGGGPFVRAVDNAESDNRFRVEYDGTVYADGSYNCGLSSGCFNSGTGADLAERIDVTESLEPGDVVEIDPDRPSHFRRSSRALSTAVAGVVSTSPAMTMNNNDLAGNDSGKRSDTRPLLALVGQIPVRVTAEGGPIAPGDLLVASSTPGHAMKAGATVPLGAVIGKALGRLEEGSGMVPMLVMLR